MELFEKIKSDALYMNPFRQIGREWMLVTAGNQEVGVNTLTACWGGLGNLWPTSLLSYKTFFQYISLNR